MDDLQDVVDTLAARLGRSVAVDDPEFRLIAASRHFGDEDALRVHSILNRSVPDEVRAGALAHGIAEWHRPGRIPGNDRLGYAERICAPVRYAAEMHGYLWLIDPEATVSAAEVAATAETAARIGELIHLRRRRSGSDRVRSEHLARLLVFGDVPDRTEAVRELAPAGRDDPALAVVVAECHRDDAETALRTAFDKAVADLPYATVLSSARAAVGFALIACAAGARDLDPAVPAQAVRTGLACHHDEEPLSFVGASAIAHGWACAPELYRQASEALEIGRRFQRDTLTWGELGADPLLLRLASTGPPPTWPGADLARRLGGGTGDSPLLETAEAYLDCAGDVRRAAARLQVHRTTLYYRLRRIEDVTGMSLRDGDDRLALHVAVRLHRLGGFDNGRNRRG